MIKFAHCPGGEIGRPACRQAGAHQMENCVFVYVIKSRTNKYIYVCLTSNQEKRVAEHNKGKERTTKPYLPFELVYKEQHSSREEARKREKQLKSGYGKEWIKKEFGL